MTKAKLLFLILLFLNTSLNSQTTDSLIGKWKFKDIYNSEKIDSASLKMLRSMFADITLYFKANKHYKAFMFKKEEGDWNYDGSLSKLTMVANKGTQSQLEIIGLTSNTLIMSIGKDKSFILERTIVTPDDEMEEPINKVELAGATLKQICKKWYLVKRDVPGRTEEQSKIVTDLANGSFFDFKSDNSYESQAFKIKAEGNWKFGQDNKSLVLTIENSTIIWKIKSISENELVLLRGSPAETWTLSTKPL